MIIPFWLRVFVHPDIELDLQDDKGKPDHSKILGYFAFSVDILLTITHNLPPLGYFICMNATLYGWIGMRTFLNRTRIDVADETITDDRPHGANIEHLDDLS